MRLLFVDEVDQPAKDPRFFGVGLFILDETFYASISAHARSVLTKYKWDLALEFKGRYIFSQKGCRDVSIEDRISLVRELVRATTGKTYSKGRFTFSYNFNGRTPENYLVLVQKVLSSIQRAPTHGKKSLIGAFYDQTSLVSAKDMDKLTRETLWTRGLQRIETACSLQSSTETPGLIFADILAYLKSWDVLDPQPDAAAQRSLFDVRPGEWDAKKLATVREILGAIKSVKVV